MRAVVLHNPDAGSGVTAGDLLRAVAAGDAFEAPPERPCTVQVALQPDPVVVLVPADISCAEE